MLDLYYVDLMFDEGSGYYLATSDDIPRLRLRSKSLDFLVFKVELAVPKILKSREVNVRFRSHIKTRITKGVRRLS